jgi:membrane protein insertase Oxa1/YidC/SpoIIIJ
MEPIKNAILSANQFLGLPWWVVLVLSSMFVRLTIFPLILVQMKRVSRIGPVAPAFVFLKDAWKFSELGTWGKIKSSIKIYRDICRQEKFRLSTIFVYNLAYYPILISMIFGIRKLLACPELSGATFLHISVVQG